MTIEHTENFRHWVQKVLPLVYDDSLSYYELLSKVTDFLNQVIDQTNELTDFTESEINDLLAEFEDIKNSVLPYNLEVTLDEWYASGKLASIINHDVFNLKADIVYVNQEIDRRINELATEGATIQTTPLIDGGVEHSHLNTDVTTFYGEKIVYDAISSFEEQLAIQYIFDVREIPTTGLSMTMEYDILTNDPNVYGARVKIFPMDTTEFVVAYGQSSSSLVALEQGKTTHIEHTYTAPQNFNYIHAFVWVTAVDNAVNGEYFIKNQAFTLNGTPLEPAIRKAYSGGMTTESVAFTPFNLTTHNQVEEKIDESFEDKTKSFNGYKVSAINNSKTQIQMAVCFDLDSINESVIAGVDQFTFEVDIESSSDLITTVYSQYRFSDNDTIGYAGTDGQLGVRDGQAFTKPKMTYRHTDPIPNNLRYAHCWIDVTLSAAITNPIDIYINNFTFSAKGQEFPRLNGIDLYQRNDIDRTVYMEYKEDQLPTFGTIHYQDSELQGATLAIMGDSISVNRNFANKLWHDFLVEDYNLLTIKNYAMSGSTIAKLGDDTNNAMCLRYDEMDDNADYIVLFGATNDSYNSRVPLGTMDSRDPVTFYGACHTIMEGFINKYPGKKIGIIIPPQRGDNGDHLLKYAKVLKEVADYYSIPSLDLYHNGGIYSPNTGVQNTLIPDGVHPNIQGHGFLSNKIGVFLNSL